MQMLDVPLLFDEPPRLGDLRRDRRRRCASSASSIATRGCQSRSAQVLAIFGTRFCTSW